MAGKRRQMNERLILALDGSTSVCSTALLTEEAGRAEGTPTVSARRSEHNGRGQARILLRLVDEMLKEVGAAPGDLDSIVVGTGPGTFTGVRIAVATARGLAVGLGIPVFGATTLSALAACAADRIASTGVSMAPSLVPIVDARRQQLFFAVYRSTGAEQGEDGPPWVRRKPIRVCERDGLRKALAGVKGPLAVVGEAPELGGRLTSRAEFVTCEVKAEYLVSGIRWVGEPRAPRSQAQGVPGTPETVRPIYVRAPDADVHITKMKDPWADAGSRK